MSGHTQAKNQLQNGTDDTELIACPFCGKVHRHRPLQPGGSARCTRCNSQLYTRPKYSLNAALALALAALFLYVPANFFTLISVNSFGNENQNLLIDGLFSLWNERAQALGVLVFVCSVAAPLVFILATLWLLIPINMGRAPLGARWILRQFEKISPWSMLDVYLLAVMVSFLKLGDLAEVGAEPGLYCLIALPFVSLAARRCFDMDQLWNRLDAITAERRNA